MSPIQFSSKAFQAVQPCKYMINLKQSISSLKSSSKNLSQEILHILRGGHFLVDLVRMGPDTGFWTNLGLKPIRMGFYSVFMNF